MVKILNIKGEELDFLRGSKGDKGDKGDRGDKGDFISGPQGLPGKAGAPGIVLKGNQGLQGIQGKTGLAGKDGTSGVDGDPGQPGQVGPTPKHQWRNTSLRFQENLDSAGNIAWGKFVDLKGDQGQGGISGYYPGSGSATQYKDVAITRDINDLVATIQQGNVTWTVTRDGSDCIQSITDGHRTRTITRTAGLVTGITVS